MSRAALCHVDKQLELLLFTVCVVYATGSCTTNASLMLDIERLAKRMTGLGERQTPVSHDATLLHTNDWSKPLDYCQQQCSTAHGR